MMFLGLEFEKLNHKVYKCFLNDETNFIININPYTRLFQFRIDTRNHGEHLLLNVLIDNLTDDIETIIERNNIYKKLCNHPLLVAFKVLNKQADKIKILV